MNSSLSGLPTVVDAIQKAGGITKYADLEEVILKRKIPGNESAYKETRLNFLKLILEGEQNNNPFLYDGDIVKLKKNEQLSPSLLEIASANLSPKTIQVTIIGEVNFPGKIELKSNTPSHTLDLRTSNEIINQAQNTKTLTPHKNHNDLDQLIQSEQAINLAIITESGQKEIQRKNTGSEGYKLESNVMANWLTGGGQTESYFSKLTGLSTEEVANQIVADAKYNKT